MPETHFKTTKNHLSGILLLVFTDVYFYTDSQIDHQTGTLQRARRQENRESLKHSTLLFSSQSCTTILVSRWLSSSPFSGIYIYIYHFVSLQVLFFPKVHEGYAFPINPVWPVRDQGWWATCLQSSSFLEALELVLRCLLRFLR